MRYLVDYDNESDGETVELSAEDVPVLGAHPIAVRDGRIALYEFDDTITEAEVLDGLEASNWSFVSAAEVDDGFSLDETPEP